MPSVTFIIIIFITSHYELYLHTPFFEKKKPLTLRNKRSYAKLQPSQLTSRVVARSTQGLNVSLCPHCTMLFNNSMKQKVIWTKLNLPRCKPSTRRVTDSHIFVIQKISNSKTWLKYQFNGENPKAQWIVEKRKIHDLKY